MHQMEVNCYVVHRRKSISAGIGCSGVPVVVHIAHCTLRKQFKGKPNVKRVQNQTLTI